MKRLFIIALVSLLTGLAALAVAWEIPTTKVASGWVATQGGGPGGVGTVQYDPPGASDAFFGSYGGWYGNRFNTAFGSTLDTGSITQLAVYFGASGATFPGVGIFGPGTTPLATGFISGLVPFTFNTIVVSGLTAVPPGFLAGVFVSSAFTSSADSVGGRAATTNGQGFHATGWSPTSTVTGINAMVRVSGSVFVPVELQSFDIE